jgi:hypothetical protein
LSILLILKILIISESNVQPEEFTTMHRNNDMDNRSLALEERDSGTEVENTPRRLSIEQLHFIFDLRRDLVVQQFHQEKMD